MPPGHEPMPSAGISVPADGSADSPVSTMSRYTVPCITTSKSSAVSGSMTRSMPPTAPRVCGDSQRRYIPFCSSMAEIERWGGSGAADHPGRRWIPGAVDLPGAAPQAGAGHRRGRVAGRRSRPVAGDRRSAGRGRRGRAKGAAGTVADECASPAPMWCSPRSGSADAAGRVRDERRALDAGVLGQETVGAGGLRYALRTLPVALESARVIADVAPDSWLINFTNPAGLVTEALRTVLGDRVIGICDSPIGLVRRARLAAGITGAPAASDRGPASRSSTMSASTIWGGCDPWTSAVSTGCRDCCPTTPRWPASRRAGCSVGHCSGRWAACPTNMPTSTTRRSIWCAS